MVAAWFEGRNDLYVAVASALLTVAPRTDGILNPKNQWLPATKIVVDGGLYWPVYRTPADKELEWLAD
jgi:hypothetical protein